MKNEFPNIRHMRVFIEVARSNSVSVAAKKCHLSQPAATQALSSLEASLGTTLLVRRRNLFTLSPSGKAFERRAQTALKHLQNGANIAARIAGGPTNQSTPFDRFVTAAQLRNLIAIANHGSFTVAARQLGLSQPTLHRAARSLEAISGIALFSARASGVTLTPAAEALVLGAKLAKAEIRQGIEEISHETGENKGTIVLGSLPLARTKIVPKAIHAMIRETENVQVRVVDGRYPELLRSLREGDLDCLIGALRFPPPADDVEQTTLFNDALAIVAHPSHPLVQRQNLTIEDTIEFPWIAPPKETPAGQYLFNTLRIHERAQTPIRAISSSLATLRGLLTEGNYVSIVSRHQISVDEELNMIAVLDIPLNGHFREIGLTHRVNWRPTKMQTKFIDFLHQYSRSSTQT